MQYPRFLLILTLSFIVFEDSRATHVQSNEKHFPSNVNVVKTITVSQSGGANFGKIQDAVNAVPSGNNMWIRILVSGGIYRLVHYQFNHYYLH